MAQGTVELAIPPLGDKFQDYRHDILGDSFNWGPVINALNVHYLTFHHSVTPQTAKDDGNWKAECDYIAKLHVNNNKWGGIGYRFVICSDGTVAYVGDLSHGGSAVANHNDITFSVVMVGDFTKHLPTDAQIRSAHILADWFINHMPAYPNLDSWEKVLGHKDWADPATGDNHTACPGDSWPNDMKWRIKHNVVYTPQPQPEVKYNTVTSPTTTTITIPAETPQKSGETTTPPPGETSRGEAEKKETFIEKPVESGSTMPQTPIMHPIPDPKAKEKVIQVQKAEERKQKIEEFKNFLDGNVDPKYVPFVIGGVALSAICGSLVLFYTNSTYAQTALPFTADFIRQLVRDNIGFILPFIIDRTTYKLTDDRRKAIIAMAICAAFGFVNAVPEMIYNKDGLYKFYFDAAKFYIQSQAMFWIAFKQFPFLRFKPSSNTPIVKETNA